jgi:hypothetical protein
LHVEIFASSHIDAIMLEIAESIRAMHCSWSRQLLFSQDPARYRKNSDAGALSVLMQEFDPQVTAETITARLNNVSLHRILDDRHAEISIRLFDLVGTSSQRLRVPMDPVDLPIQNKLHSKSLEENSDTSSYFGLRAESYVHM